MLVYIPFIVFTAFGAVTKYRKNVYRLALVYLFFISAFRSYSFGGTDSLFYQAFFRTIPTLFNLNISFFASSPYGPGFVLLGSFAKTIYDDYLCFQILLSFVSIFLLDRVIRNIPDSGDNYTIKLQFLVCYFCYRFVYNNWISLRQNIANLLVWIAILSLGGDRDKKSYFKAILLVLASSLFHNSSIVNLAFIPLLLLMDNIQLRTKIMLVIPTSLLLLLFSESIFVRALSVFSAIDIRYSNYSSGVGSNLVNYAVRIISLLLLYFNIDRIESKKKYIMFNTLLVMCLIGSVNVAIVYRFYEYYAIGLYYTLAYIPHMFRKSSGSYFFAYSILLAGLFIIFYRFCITMDDGLYLTYQFLNR